MSTSTANSRVLEPDEPHGVSAPLPHHPINYVAIFYTLVVLTVVTVAVAFFRFKFELVNVALALLIASSKAGFVCRYFMHLKYEGKLIYLILLVPVSLAIIMIVALIPDIGRGRETAFNDMIRMFQQAMVGTEKVNVTTHVPDSIVDISHLTHAYGKHTALDDLSLEISSGEVFGFLGPNGSGKTTLFRILSTLIPVAPGHVKIMGVDPATDRGRVRAGIGVVFQSPSLDKQLSARENLTHQGHLYGISGRELEIKVEAALAAVNLGDRANERVSRFSGGMRRRVEIAKGLLHEPGVLLLDEPSTGLDPSARIDLWRELRRINVEQGVTILVTTHMMDEADRCTRLAILSRGALLACDRPAALKERIGGDVVTLTSSRPEELRTALHQRLGIDAAQVDQTLRFERAAAHTFVPQLIEAVPGMVESVAVGKPTLEDVFISLTGRRLETEDAPPPIARSKRS